MVALSACPGRREVVVWASYWRRDRSGNAIGLTKVARQSAVRAQHGPYCSHTEERFSDIWRPHGDLVDYLGRHGRSMVAVLCDGGLNCKQDSESSLTTTLWHPAAIAASESDSIVTALYGICLQRGYCRSPEIWSRCLPMVTERSQQWQFRRHWLLRRFSASQTK